jgi:hypothetical protein
LFIFYIIILEMYNQSSPDKNQKFNFDKFSTFNKQSFIMDDKDADFTWKDVLYEWENVAPVTVLKIVKISHIKIHDDVAQLIIKSLNTLCPRIKDLHFIS